MQGRDSASRQPAVCDIWPWTYHDKNCNF